MNLTPYFFFASPHKAEKHFLQTPRLGRGAYLEVGRAAWLRLTPDTSLPKAGEEEKDKVGTWGKQEKLIRGQGLALTSLRERGTCSLGDSEFQGKRNGPSLIFQLKAPVSGPDLPFLLPATRIPAPQATLKKAWGIVNSNFAG